ncbi:MAG: zinc ribbon domain-containing protein [Candidatus Saccharicenans sp.]|nr:zinc ribbon domain-containing protein [Candidatus Saccharicenans sp.]
MPLYEYRCANCQKEFEVLQKVSDEPLTVCPECGGSLRRLISSPAIQFKGSGWYITDYALKNSPGGNGRNGGQKRPEEEKTKPAGQPASSSTKPASGT